MAMSEGVGVADSLTVGVLVGSDGVRLGRAPPDTTFAAPGRLSSTSSRPPQPIAITPTTPSAAAVAAAAGPNLAQSGQRAHEPGRSSGRDAAASSRVATPSFERICETWYFAPSSEMSRRWAISSFVKPWPRRARTSRSRGVRTSGGRFLIGGPRDSSPPHRLPPKAGLSVRPAPQARNDTWEARGR